MLKREPWNPAPNLRSTAWSSRGWRTACGEVLAGPRREARPAWADALRRALALVLLVLRLDRRTRLFPLGVAPGEELGERCAVREPPAAVERDGLAGEPLAAVGHEKHREVLQLVHFPRALHRVQAYAVAAPLDGERLRHDLHARFRHRRRHDEWRARPHPGDDDRDHGSRVLARDPALAHRVRDVESAVQHGVRDGVEPARREVLGARDEVSRRVVDEAGERPAVLPDRLHHRVDRRRVADIDGVAFDRAAVLCHQLGGGFLEHGFSAAAEGEIGAELEIFRGHLAAEAGAAAGHEDALALEEVFPEHGLDGQYDLADVRARLHQLVRLRGFGEREGLVDHRLDFAPLDERPDFLAQVPRDRALELDRARAQRGTGDCQAAAQDVAEIEGRLAAAEESDDDDAAVVGEAFQLAVDVVAPDHVEDHIDPLAAGRFLHRRSEVLGLVVYGAVGAELRARRALLGAACRCKHGVAESLHHLDRGDADAGGSSLHEEGLAGLQPGAVEDVAPHGEEGLGQRRGFERRHALRNRQALRSRRRAVFGVAAALHERGHRVADAPFLHAFAERGDAAGELQTRDVGGARRHRIVAGALHRVGAVDAGGRDADQDFAALRLGNRARADFQHLGPARPGDLDRAHGRHRKSQPQTLFATSMTNPSLRHWSSAVSLLPWWVLEKPHCGERHRASSATYRAAASMRRFRSSFFSRSGTLELTRPSTTVLPFGTWRSGSKPPARSVSYSRKKASTSRRLNTV